MITVISELERGEQVNLDDIRARHVPRPSRVSYSSGRRVCRRCGQDWGETGCDTAIVLAALDAAAGRETRLREALADIADGTSYDPDGSIGVTARNIARAALVVPEAEP